MKQNINKRMNIVKSVTPSLPLHKKRHNWIE